MNPDTLNSTAQLTGMAAVGKTAAALLVIILMILACAWLLHRLRQHGGMQQKLLQVVASSSVGPKERVVIVAVEDTWLVLGVANGTVNKLHELPAPAGTGSDNAQYPQFAPDDSFSARLGKALRYQTSRLGKTGDTAGSD